MNLQDLNHVDFFIQIGANDGITDDPLHDLIRRHHWRGLLVEPLPDIFEKLKLNYADQPQLSFENVAITKESGTIDFFRHPRYPQCSGLHIVTDMQCRARMEKVKVKGLTFRDLCARHQINKVDLLQIDTEGFDLDIIKLIPWDILTPRIIRFEHKHLDKVAAQCYLAEHGYNCSSDKSDTTAVLVDSATPAATP